MSDNSAILALPYIQPSQAQKHVTHNEALARLDVLVQLSVVGFGATTPPALPDEGETYALGSSPTDAWAAEAGMLATWRDAGWHFIAPLVGWRAWGQTAQELRVWDGTAWALPVSDLNNLDGLGIGTSYDATNRLSVRSDATLLSHDGDDHRLKLNKASDANTASLLFQSNWTGHAEMGLSGDTDFAIKVSGDGSTWTEALKFNGTNGAATGAAIQTSAAAATMGKITVNGKAAEFSSLAVSNPGDCDLAIESLTSGRARLKLLRPAGRSWEIGNDVGNFRILNGSPGITDTNLTLQITGSTIEFKDPASGLEWMRLQDGRLKIIDGVIEVGGNRIGGQSMTIADDAVAVFTPPRTGGFALITCGGDEDYPSAGDSVMIYYDVGPSLKIEKSAGWSGPGANVAVVETDVTGTTGTDGKTTIAVQAAVLKVENRTGASRSYQITWL